MRQSYASRLVPALLLVAATTAYGARPTTEALLQSYGYSASDIAGVRAGKIERRRPPAAHERDLTAGFVFFVPLSPSELVDEVRAGLLDEPEEAASTSRTIAEADTLDAFSGLTLEPDRTRRAARYTRARGGDDLNLSTSEIAAFNALGPAAAPEAVEMQVRQSLLSRYQAYRTGGLAGIEPYDRGQDKTRSVADDLRAALEAMTALRANAPAAHAAMLRYPDAQLPGTQQAFRWKQLSANGIPTIVLGHGLFIPDGDARIVLQRQYYASEGFNCEQAVAAFLPVEGGTVVVYINHTSTDQVGGFGGGTKRSIGSKLMASELEAIFTKAISAPVRNAQVRKRTDPP